MAINDIVQTIAEARIDAQSLSEFVFKPAGFIVNRRLAPPINTLQYYLDRIDSVDSEFSQALSAAAASAENLISDVTNQASQSVQNAIQGVAIDANLVTDALIKTVPTGGAVSSVVRTQASKNAENITIADFGATNSAAPLSDRFATLAEAQAVYPHAIALTDTIDWCAVQAFFDYCKANAVANAIITGTFYVNREVNYVLQGHNGLTKNFVGHMYLWATAGMHHVIRIAGSFLTFDSIRLRKSTSEPIPYGLFLGGFLDSNSTINTHIGTIETTTFDVASVNVNQNTMFCTIGNARGGGGKVGTLNFSNPVTGGFPYNTTLTVDTMPFFKSDIPRLHGSDADAPNSFIAIAGRLYRIVSKDVVNNTITVFPRYVGDSTGTAKYIQGAFFHHNGNNAGCIQVGTINAYGGGTGISECSLYTGKYDNLITEFCGLGIAVGASGNDPAMCMEVTRSYFEANTYDYAQSSTFKTQLQTRLGNAMGLNPAKMFALSIDDPLEADGEYLGVPSRGALGAGEYNIDNELYRPDISPHSFGSAATTIELAGKHVVRNMYYVYAPYAPNPYDIVINLKINSKIFELMGSLNLTLSLLCREDINRVYTGSITINAPTGYTLNDAGATSLVFSGFYANPTIRITATRHKAKSVILAVSGLNSEFVNAYNKIKTVVSKGTTAQRPTSPVLGQQYYDTTLLETGKPINWNGTDWVDAAGTTV